MSKIKFFISLVFIWLLLMYPHPLMGQSSDQPGTGNHDQTIVDLIE